MAPNMQIEEQEGRYGDQVELFALDVTDEAAAANAVKTAIDLFGPLDVVINNAGYGNLSSIEDTPLSEFRAQIETNLFGTIIVTGVPGLFCTSSNERDWTKEGEGRMSRASTRRRR
jgi:NAD(P)-dependent dehydrogenase (short-subunit alcohol dehydrogenase family)